MATSLQPQLTKFYDNGVIDMEKDNLKEVEGNYLVLDWKDVREALSEENLDILKQLIFAVRHTRGIVNGKEPLEGIFVEKSYPFYEDTLQKLRCTLNRRTVKWSLWYLLVDRICL